MLESKSNKRSKQMTGSERTLVAVIDIGTISVRMAIGEIIADGNVRPLETLSQPVSLGMDSFVSGRIGRKTIRRCVEALKIYRRKLAEYGIKETEGVRVVATSAVREARNRMEFVDRVYTLTGFEIEPFDEAEVHRVTYLGILDVIQDHPDFAKGVSCVVEIGGGSTETMVLHGRDVLFARTFRMGSLRLRRTLDAYQTPTAKVRQIVGSQIDQLVNVVRKEIGDDVVDRLVVMGGDIRLVLRVLNKTQSGTDLFRLELQELERFVDEIWSCSPDELVSRYRLGIADAESLGPALLSYVNITKELQQDHLWVAPTNLRDGLMKEMALGGDWSGGVGDQIIRSATSIAQRYQVDLVHAIHVAELCNRLFDELFPLHGFPQNRQLILHVAALLHEVGLYVSHRSYHKHSQYLIRNSEFFGLDAKNLQLVSLIARYHRRANPQPSHDGYSSLNRKSRATVARLAAILRVAKALDAGRSQRINDFNIQIQAEQIVISVENVNDISIENLELRQTCSLFEEVFGRPIVLRSEYFGASEK